MKQYRIVIIPIALIVVGALLLHSYIMNKQLHLSVVASDVQSVRLWHESKEDRYLLPEQQVALVAAFNSAEFDGANKELSGTTYDSGINPITNTKEVTVGNFKITLTSDKQVYRKDEKINVFASFMYCGEQEKITIWHGEPYLGFSIKDDKGKFSMDSLRLGILKSTMLNKGEQNKFVFTKSGGFDANDPKAEFWRQFYVDPDLHLPVGNYTISAAASISLDKEKVKESSVVVPVEVRIRVVD